MRARIEGLWADDQQIESTRDGAHFRMASGREYVASSSLLASEPGILQANPLPFTRYIDEHPEEQPVVFTTYNAPAILSRPPIPFGERAQLLAREIIRLLGHRPGEMSITMSPDNKLFMDLLRAAYIDATSDLIALLKYWQEQGVFELKFMLDQTAHLKVPVRGVIALEQEMSAAPGDTAFVAMWFSPEMTAAYDEAILPAIEQLGYRAVRIDRQEHNNKIDDEIIAEIRRARFVVADFSCNAEGARGGVYYEAGFAAGLGKPVIFTVRESDLSRVHFDTRQFNHIVWSDVTSLRERLSARIGATIGRFNR